MDKIAKHRRHEIIYQLLRRHDEDSGLTAVEVHGMLKREGIKTDLRTIRRDLIDLSSTHGLSSNGQRPERYYPSKNFQFKYELQLNENTLQVLFIALNYLKYTTHEYFRHFATEAENAILDSFDTRVVEDLRAAREKYYFDFSTSGRASPSDLKDFEKIMTAIRDNRVISCINSSPYKDSVYNQKRRTFAPYMFILTSGIPYLIVQDRDDGVFKKLRVTRVGQIKILKETFDPIHYKDYFHLSQIVGGWGGIEDEAVKIHITADCQMATYFQEKSIHRTQKVTQKEEDKYEIEFECAISHEIVRLLSSFGGHIEKVKPDYLFEEVKAIWAEGLKKVA